jgi:hypothetical protein
MLIYINNYILTKKLVGKNTTELIIILPLFSIYERR